MEDRRPVVDIRETRCHALGSPCLPEGGRGRGGLVKKKRIPDGLRAWIDARKRHHLSHAHVQMARERGMNPKKLGGLDNHRQERWKLPLPVFIEELYSKRFGRARPEFVSSIEEHARRQERKRAEKREAKLQRREAAAGEAGGTDGTVGATTSSARGSERIERLAAGAGTGAARLREAEEGPPADDPGADSSDADG